MATKNYRNGALNPNAFRRTPISEDEILDAKMLNYPLTQYMFCAPDEGAAAVVLCRADIAQRYTSQPIFLPRHRTPDPPVRGVRGAQLVGCGRRGRVTDGVRIAAPHTRQPGSSPRMSMSSSSRTRMPAPEIIHMAENGFCADGDQEKLIADKATEIDGPMPVNTDGGLIANGEPIGASGLRQVHEIVAQLRRQAGDRQVPGAPRVGYAQLYGAPGVAAVSILTT